MTSGNKSILQVNICVLLLGGTALFAKLISLPAEAITFFRSIFACLALISIMIITKSVFRLQSLEDYWLILFTGLLTGGHWLAYFHSIQLSTVAVGIISLYTFPIMTSFLEPLLDHERIRFKNIVRAAIVFAGILLIVPKFELSNQATAGVLWGLASATLFSIRNITVKKKLGHLSSLTSMCYQLFIISIMLLPVDAVNRFKQLSASNTLAVLIILYGNRAFEDALLELKNLAVELGFIPVAGGAFIGEHSFATKDAPIANGRPDSQDLQIAMNFGEKIKAKVTAFQSPDAKINLKIPGRFPYMAGGARSMAVSPVTKEDSCTVCGTCASVCPTAAILTSAHPETVILPDICVMLKILSSEYQPYTCGKIFRMP